MSRSQDLDVVVIGGCGHVGLPLALSLADAGLRVGIFDIDAVKVGLVEAGRMPFIERGADELLQKLLPTGRLVLSSEPGILSETSTVVLVIGTPIDEFLNPSFKIFDRALEELAPKLRDDSLVVLRSTVYPGTTDRVSKLLADYGLGCDVVFCPERIAEGYALEEVHEFPQIVGASSDRAFSRASGLFQALGVEILRTTPKEAELTKLMTNSWRYLKFAVANQFFQIAHASGIDYENVLHAIRHNYPRAADLPGPGFAAGPCLLKDTMQLASFSRDNFPMGHAAMLVNEGLPGYVLAQINNRHPLEGRKLGILGMAFKGESDDPRTSLAYKLKKLAEFWGAITLCTDPYVPDPNLLPLEIVLGDADVFVIAAPHKRYQQIDFGGRPVVDIWRLTGRGVSL
jgi:UDP-N-acetyl-D-mannosaminuronic acid dehydrogenase